MMTPKHCITDLPDSAYDNKRVLIRADFNVPQNEDGSIASDYRIQETLPTLKYLLDRHARLIIATHLGRPKAGQLEDKYKLKPVVEALRKLLPDTHIMYFDHLINDETTQAANNLKPGEILVLENIRFEPGETDNSPDLSHKLALLADVYVNDAFGAAHRAHASTEGVAHFVPTRVAGLLMHQELTVLNHILADPPRPFTAVIGGSKVSSKIDVLQQLLKNLNNLIIGGGMVFTFLKAQGYSVGSSLVEDDYIETAANLMKAAESQDKLIILPKDIVVANKFAADANTQIVSAQQIPDGWMGLDIGPESSDRVCDVVKNAKTVFWNGPLGVFEMPPFATATHALATCLSKATQAGHLTSILGGGDTQAAIDLFGFKPTDFTHVSTGGGASMELLEGKDLPGVVVLQDKVLSGVS